MEVEFRVFLGSDMVLNDAGSQVNMISILGHSGNTVLYTQLKILMSITSNISKGKKLLQFYNL